MIRRLTTLTMIASLTACSLAPTYVRPEAPVPPSWPIGDAYLRIGNPAYTAQNRTFGARGLLDRRHQAAHLRRIPAEPAQAVPRVQLHGDRVAVRDPQSRPSDRQDGSRWNDATIDEDGTRARAVRGAQILV